MDGTDTLQTISEVATAFAGFTGVIVAVGHRSTQWDPAHQRVVMLLLESSLAVVFFGLVPAIAESALLDPRLAWRTSLGLFAIYHASIIFRRGPCSDRSATPETTAPLVISNSVAYLFAAGGALTIALKALVALGAWPQLAFFVYSLALLWLLAVSTLCFAAFLISMMRAV